MEKKQYRNIYIKNRQSIAPEKRRQFSKETLDHLLKSNFYKEARSIFTFVSMVDEIETRKWIPKFLEDGKEVYIPFTQKGDVNMYMTQIFSLEETQEDYMGILQVPPTLLEERKKDQVDLVLVPGLAFDNQGYRMGYGGGFYDRFLAKAMHKWAMGVGFAQQRVDSVIKIDTDLPVQGYFCQKGLEVF